MLASSFSRSSGASRKVLFQTLLGGVSLVSAYGCFQQYTKYLQVKKQWEAVENHVQSQEEPVDITNKNSRIYPWNIGRNGVQDWEYKLVKMTGYFREERFFIKREKDGKQGYLVLAPFITGLEGFYANGNDEQSRRAQYTVFVNLGWVPLENKGDIERTTEAVPVLDVPEEAQLLVKSPFNGMNSDQEAVDEFETAYLQEIVGLVRKGEEGDILSGLRNFPQQGHYTYIDLPFWGKFFRLYNLDGASSCYIERVVPSFEDSEEEQLYPVPATKDSFDKTFLNPRPHLDYSAFWGTTCGLSVLSLLAFARK